MKPRTLIGTAALAVTTIATAQDPAASPTTENADNTNPASNPLVFTKTTGLRDLASLELNVNKLQTESPIVFNIATNATSAENDGQLTFNSKLTLRTNVRDGAVVLADTWKIMGRTCHVSMTCQPNSFLALKECSMDMSAGDKTAGGTVVVQNGSATGEVAGRNVTVTYPEGTVNMAAIFRIVTQIPTTPGVTYTFPTYSEAIELRAQQPQSGQNFSITCNGPKTTIVNDSEVECTSFTVNVNKPFELFVDAKSNLQKVVADKGSTVMIRQTGTATAGVDADH